MSALPQSYYDLVTTVLRADQWTPRKEYACGCCPERLCAGHAERRAVDHYHPETIR